MDGRGVAWVGYLPVPGLALVPALARPADRLARYHAWQSGVLVGLLWLALLAFGLVAGLSQAAGYRSTVGLLSGLTLLAALGQLAWGAFGASQGRYPRLRPAWDVCRLLRGD